MQLLKSALGMGEKPVQKKTKHQEIYSELKRWDQKRAAVLELQLRTCRQGLNMLELKARQSEAYICDIETIMRQRITEIKEYCKNGLNNSEFLLAGNYSPSFKPQYDLLKTLMMQDSQRELALLQKATVLGCLLEDILRLKEEECSQSKDTEGTSLLVLKSTVRLLLDCELPDIVEEVVKAVQAVSLAYQTEGQDFYLAVHLFVGLAQQQRRKHEEIGREVVALAGSLVTREHSLQRQTRAILAKWVAEDLGEKNIFQEQLKKNTTNSLIGQYYSLEEVLPASESSNTVEAYLCRISLDDFTAHHSLVLLDCLVSYNSCTDARLVLTSQKYLYLWTPKADQPDFAFLLALHTLITKTTPVTLTLAHKPAFLNGSDFNFSLQFHDEAALDAFLAKTTELALCTIHHIIQS